MPYDFEEVFSKNSKKENPNDVENSSSKQTGEMSVSEKDFLFTKQNSKDSSEARNKFTNLFEKAKGKNHNVGFNNVFQTLKDPHLSETDAQQKDLRSLMVKSFIDQMMPTLNSKPTFNYEFNRFKLLMSINSLFIAILTMLFLNPLTLIFGAMMMIIFLFFQIHSKFLLENIEGKVWKTIKNLPPVQSKQLLHSILSNNFLNDTYSEEEIKEIIFNFLQTEDSVLRESATIKIRDNIVIIKSMLLNIYSGNEIPVRNIDVSNSKNIELTPINPNGKDN